MPDFNFFTCISLHYLNKQDLFAFANWLNIFKTLEFF